ncbi:hypothetical protein KIJ00_03150 [Leuconostoc gelidum subsp. aenigmaticum]|uniref:hypothetical protein n=1 Tax=Leuconostoc gelidum TaxID=1244 RepID=UPI001CC6946B|nr:hypothetical protein [Leuconostoc gelidum]MBZ6008260.1 hypothetical protein [Leuconostoc gelidum subsp. aenigmaticum]
MNQKNIKIIKRYIKIFSTWSFAIAGTLFFSFTFVAMTTIPTMKSSDISNGSHISTVKIAEAIQMSLGFWQFLFWFPIACGLVFTLMEGLQNYYDYKRKLRKASNL